jgi:hypothetical protein
MKRVAEQRHGHEARGRCSYDRLDRKSTTEIRTSYQALLEHALQLVGLEDSPALLAAAHRAKTQTSRSSASAYHLACASNNQRDNVAGAVARSQPASLLLHRSALHWPGRELA